MTTAVNELHERVSGTLTEAQNSLREQLARELESAQTRWQATLESAIQAAQEQASGALHEQTKGLRAELQEEGTRQSASVREAIEAHTRQLGDILGRANSVSERLEQHAARIETVQQQAVDGFQSQFNDVLSLPRNGSARSEDRSRKSRRIHSSFEAANSAALGKFDGQVQSLVRPRQTHTEEAIHRLAGGRSLLDAAMTMQQDRVRATADEAFADSLARFRENLGTVEQILNESSQTITGRNLEELESKAADLKRHTLEEMFKSAEWYEKKTQTQLQSLTEKLAEQSDAQLREKAGEVSGVFSGELSQASRGFVAQTQQQLEESVRDAFERVRILFSEAADTTSAAFTDEIQRNARQELDGFNELVQKGVEESRERLDAARVEYGNQLNSGQEEFLRRFQTSMRCAVERGRRSAQEKRSPASTASGFVESNDNHQAIGNAQRSGADQQEAASQYRGGLENIPDSSKVVTVATLDHQSRDVIAEVAATTEARLKEAPARPSRASGSPAGAPAADGRGFRQAHAAEALAGSTAHALASCEAIPLAMAGLWQSYLSWETETKEAGSRGPEEGGRMISPSMGDRGQFHGRNVEAVGLAKWTSLAMAAGAIHHTGLASWGTGGASAAQASCADPGWLTDFRRSLTLEHISVITSALKKALRAGRSSSISATRSCSMNSAVSYCVQSSGSATERWVVGSPGAKPKN